MNDTLPVEQTGQVQVQPVPFGGRTMLPAAHVNSGAVEIESQRAIAEAQGQLLLAKRFPRDMQRAMQIFMESCASPEFAAEAFYSVPNRGTGPSIRFAEECARCYGNFDYGHRELSRGGGKSEIEVYAWDKEQNNRSTRQITIAHIVDTKNGPKVLRDQADIDNRIANVASKQMRGRILALLPKSLVAAGVDACKRTLAGKSDKPDPNRVARMVAAFERHGVPLAALEKRLGHALGLITVEQFADLSGVFNAIRDGAAASEYFEVEPPKSEPAPGGAAALAETAKRNAAARPKPKADPEPDAAPTPAPDTAKSKSAEKVSKPVDEKQAEAVPQQESPPPADTDAPEDEDVF